LAISASAFAAIFCTISLPGAVEVSTEIERLPKLTH
jgi:hypothetical protein